MKHVKFSNNFLAAEEAFIARAIPDRDMYELDISKNFYEFIPLYEQEKTLLAHELTPGGEYCVVVS